MRIEWRGVTVDIQKLKPQIEEKLDLDNLFKDESNGDKNPDWQSFFRDTNADATQVKFRRSIASVLKN